MSLSGRLPASAHRDEGKRGDMTGRFHGPDGRNKREKKGLAIEKEYPSVQKKEVVSEKTDPPSAHLEFNREGKKEKREKSHSPLLLRNGGKKTWLFPPNNGEKKGKNRRKG